MKSSNKAFKTGLSPDSHFLVKAIITISRVGCAGSAQTAAGLSPRAGRARPTLSLAVASCPS